MRDAGAVSKQLGIHIGKAVRAEIVKRYEERERFIADELIVELCKFLPYENIQPEDGTPQAAGVPDHTVSAQVLNALLAELSGEFRDNVSAALKKRSVQFSKTLLEKAHLLVKKYSWEPFSKWVASLDLALESFDIALMETVLKEFEPMLRKAKDVLSGMNNN